MRKGTVGRRACDKNKTATGSTKMLGPIRTVFNAAQEAELVTHILSMEARFFKLTTRDVRYIAFHAARRNNVDHKFNKEVFGEADYLPAHPTDIPFEGEQEEEDLDEPVAQPIMALENESDLEAVEPENSSVLVPKVARRLFKPGRHNCTKEESQAPRATSCFDTISV
ncbi:hypothetical protein O3P69_003375 [Scylla paramamosain]|uniref:Uncharacterized protein n=1 Tax=Scylla paramamosain TaxID=85552 RepID=A0AAW0UGE9_SCYPA